MDEALTALRTWRKEGRDAALATLVRVEGSAPRGVGAKLAVSAEGLMAGSVSGGCVEGDVVEHARAALLSGEAVMRRYGISDEQGLEVGLMCGGSIEVVIEPMRGQAAALVELFTALIEAGKPAAREIGLDGEPSGTRRVLDGQLAVTAVDTPDAVYDRALPPPRVWIVGAGHVAEHVAAYAGRAGFAPLVVDPRRLFAEQPRGSFAQVGQRRGTIRGDSQWRRYCDAGRPLRRDRRLRRRFATGDFRWRRVGFGPVHL